ncbi:uracil-DNA glycosylase family protein [Parasphingorhabdus sp.]|uniref:uracil-DNA glycosylase family protein n=1 Tax=Parasphingorhabdus sp. TaxID=2709688 RepID=UPI0032EE9092
MSSQSTNGLGIEDLLSSIRSCTLCNGLPLGPQPIIQAAHSSRILVAGQAPGSRTHEKGVPFDDASGERLRHWMGIGRTDFYNPNNLAIVPMGFCYPGTGRSGDLPPRPECAKQWRASVLDRLPDLELTLIIGSYAMDWHLGKQSRNLTETVRNWNDNWPKILVLPHPSPRNNLWLHRNRWFEEEILPILRNRIASILSRTTSL